MQSTIDQLIAHLTEFKSAEADLDSVKSEHDRLTSENESLKAAIESASQELSGAQAGLSAAQVKNLENYNTSIFNQSNGLKRLTAAVDVAQGKLADLTTQVAAASNQHQQILDSMDSLRRKLG